MNKSIQLLVAKPWPLELLPSDPAGAAEDHMKCLELLGILISFMEKGQRILTAALQHLSALPVPLLRQVCYKSTVPSKALCQ